MELATSKLGSGRLCTYQRGRHSQHEAEDLVRAWQLPEHLVALYSLTAQPHCTASLHSLTTQPHCTASLHSLTAQPHCTASLHSLTTQPHCTASLHSHV